MTQVSIGSYAREMIAANPQATNQELLDMVLAKFQQANTSLACIAWYKSNMKKNGYNKKVQERTLDVIKANIAEVEMSLELLKEELELKILEEREHVEAQFKYYADLKAQLDAQEQSTTPDESAPLSEENQRMTDLEIRCILVFVIGVAIVYMLWDKQ